MLYNPCSGWIGAVQGAWVTCSRGLRLKQQDGPVCVQILTHDPLAPTSRHLDISRDRLSSYYKFKLTRKVLSLFVQKLGNLMSLDISGHMILENCSISKMDEEAGQTRWGPTCPVCEWVSSNKH